MSEISKNSHSKLAFRYMRILGKKESLIDFLTRRFKYLSKQNWINNINNNKLLVDGDNCIPDQILKNNQTIIYLRHDSLEPKVNTKFNIIYEDEFIISVNKPSNLPTSPSGKYYKNTLVNLLKTYNFRFLYTLHRLDRETSGVTIFAKDKITARKMSTLFREQKIKKKYIAILEKELPANEILVSMPIGKDPSSEIRIKQAVIPNGRFCKTHFKQINKINDFFVVEVVPFTGRTHQIRVHSKFFDCPIVGDKLYGLSDEKFIKWLNHGEKFLRNINFFYKRQLLHALEISFEHPITGKKILIIADESNMLSELNYSF